MGILENTISVQDIIGSNMSDIVLDRVVIQT